jgi:hypothetical protein
MRTATLWVAAVPLLLAPAIFAFTSGGFFYKPQLFGGIVVFTLLALAAVAAPWPLVSRGVPLAALAALAGLTIWTGLSISWARLLGPATDDTDRVVLYLACFALALVVLRDRRIRELAPDIVLFGIAVVTLYALATRLLPHVVPSSEVVRAGSRLAQPLTYWNAEGLFTATGTILAIAVAANAARPRGVRALAAAVAVPCGFAMFLTFSRGAWVALLGGLIVLGLMRPRWATLGAAAVAASGAGLLALSLIWFPAVRALDRGVSSQASQGGVVTALGVVVTAAAGLAYLRLTRTARDTQPLRLPARARRVALIATVPVLLGIAVVIALSAEQTVHIPTSATRLVKFEANRKAYWRVALETFADHPVAGVGTASYQVEWRRKRTNADFVSDAHSLYLETLAELGIVGALLLAALYATATTGLVRGARAAPGDPALAAAAAVLAAFAIHAGVDWDWEMPAVTLPALIMAAVAVQRPFRIPS